ncbi:MAG: hypothetical protein ACYCVD_02765 [Desulfitobacteriaceae bacterium]
MALGDYVKTTFIEGSAPGLSATRLNNNENKTAELDQAQAAHLADDVHHIPYGVDTGVANAYIITLSPAPTAYIDGMGIAIKIVNASTGTSTLNVNALGTKPILDTLGNALTATNNLKAGLIYSMRYNATSGNFIVQGKGGGGNATAGQLLINATATVDAGQIVGTMPNKEGSATVLTPSGADIIIPQGYFGGVIGDGKVAAVVVPAANVLAGTTIAGTAGTMPANGSPTIAPGVNAQSLAAGNYTGGTVNGDANLIAANILTGISIFGVAGTAKRQASGTITSVNDSRTYYYSDGTTVSKCSITVSGLTFTPSVIVMIELTSGDIFIFTPLTIGTTGRITEVYNIGGNNALITYANEANLKLDGVAAYVNTTGFRMPANYIDSYNWYAYE